MSVSGNNKVFMIGWEYPPYNSGGLGVACKGLTEALASQNTDIHFTLPYLHSQGIAHMNMLECSDPSWSEGEIEHLFEPPFSVYDSTLESELRRKMPQDLDQHELRSLPRSQLEAKVDQYAQVVKQEGSKIADKYDVIHAHDWMSFPAGVEVKKATGKPLVTHIHSTEYDRSALGSGSSYIAQTELEGLRASDRVIAVSNYTKKLLIQKYGIQSNKIDVVHNGIAPLSNYPEKGWHHFAQKRPVVAFMGRLTLHKGVDYFIKVARRVVAQVPEVLFVVAGSGDMYHELLFQTAKEGLSASILFSGFIRSTQKDKLLNRADVFIMPSVSEPFGLVALEAAQKHIPVIISRNAGVSEVMKHSLSIDFWDINKMSNSVIQLLQDQGYAQTVRDGQLDDLSQVTWEKAAKKVREIYRRAFLG